MRLSFSARTVPLPTQSTTSDEPQLVDPNELVLQAVQRSVFGPPFACKVRQKTSLFDREINSLGTCVQGGEGSGKLKQHVSFTVGNDVRNVEQMCDGRFLWTSTDPKSAFRTVNIESIRASIVKRGKWDTKQPELALTLAIGGQAEVLRTLYIKYRWFKAFRGSLDGVPVWQLVGTTRTQRPPVMPNVVSDHALFGLQQEDFPTEVRLTLARSLFPYRIEYYHRKKDPKNGAETLHPFASIEYFELVSPIQETEGYFKIQLPMKLEIVVTGKMKPSFSSPMTENSTLCQQSVGGILWHLVVLGL